jgi:hypothetical protein
MDWHDEGEQLIADTLACDESASEASPPLVPSLPEPERTDIDIRREIQERLSAFRNYQHLQTIARDAYYEQAMQRIRAVTEQWA